MRIYALLSTQETACAETALCATHLTPTNKQDIIRRLVDDILDTDWQDCSLNDALSCVVCGETFNRRKP